MSTTELQYLSDRLASTAKVKINAPTLFKPVLRQDAFSMPVVLSEIFSGWMPERVSREKFESWIEEFNLTAEAPVTFAELQDIHWVRIINGHVKLPRTIMTLAGGYYKDVVGQLGEKMQRYLLFLSDKVKFFLHDQRVRIQKEYVDKKIEEAFPGMQDEILRSLKAANLLQERPMINGYLFNLSNMPELDNNELAARLFQASVQKDARVEVLRDYLERINALCVSPRTIGSYLTDPDKRAYGNLLRHFLLSEDDLQHGDTEFARITLDNLNPKHSRLKEPPADRLCEDCPYDLIQKAEGLDRGGGNYFFHQDARMIYDIALSILVQTDDLPGEALAQTRSLMTEVTRPFISITLFYHVHLRYPHLIPYLLEDLSTLPLAFLAINDLEYLSNLNPPANKWTEPLDEAQEWRKGLRAALFRHAILAMHRYWQDKAEIARACHQTMDILLKSALGRRVDSGVNVRLHLEYLGEYRHFFKLLGANKVSDGAMARSFPLDDEVLEKLADLITRRPAYRRSEFLSTGDEQFQHAVELLKVLYARKATGAFIGSEAGFSDRIINALTTYIRNIFTEFLTFKDVLVARDETVVPEVRAVRRWAGNMITEIPDWGFVFAVLEESGDIHEILRLLAEQREHFETNKTTEYSLDAYQTSEMLKTVLRTFMLGFIALNERRAGYYHYDLHADRICSLLAKTIADIAVNYHGGNLYKGEISIFAERHGASGKYLYTEDLLSMLIRCVNFRLPDLNDNFITDFFASSENLQDLLNAINQLTSAKARRVLSDQVLKLDAEKFIQEHPADSLDTLINAVNSDRFWKSIGEPLIKHLDRPKPPNLHYHPIRTVTLYELKLLVSFKNKDRNGLYAIALPTTNGPAEQREVQAKETFYHAAFALYNERKYGEAIELLERLILDYPKSSLYRAHLYRAKTLNAVAIDDNSRLAAAYNEWKSYFNTLSDDDSERLGSLDYIVAGTKVHYYYRTRQYIELDSVVSHLPDPYKYDLDIIEPVSNAYANRKLMADAVAYIVNACTYQEDEQTPIPRNILRLKEEMLIDRDATTYLNATTAIRSLPPASIPKVLPRVVNGGLTLEDFVLREIVRASDVLVDHRTLLGDSPTENAMNSLIKIVLEQRAVIWGWDVGDQSLQGKSIKGKNPGQPDLKMKAAGVTHALIEGLKHDNRVEEHLTRMRQNYSHGYPAYYMLIYFTGDNLDQGWEHYKTKIREFDFAKRWKIGKKGELLEEIDHIELTQYIRVGKNQVGDKITVYHIFLKTEF